MDNKFFSETLGRLEELEGKNYQLEKENKKLTEKLRNFEGLEKENKNLVSKIHEKSMFRDTMLEMYHNELMLKAKKIEELESKIKELEKGD